MLISQRGKRLFALGLGVTLVVTGCGKKDKNDDDEESDPATVSGGGGGSTTSGGLSSASSVADLKLSGLSISLPAALDASSGSGLRLTTGKKSAEACLLGSSVKEITSRLDEIAGFACHIEVEKDKIVFGRKYKITVQGQEFGRIMVEKATDKVVFANCMVGDHTGSSLIDITSLTDAGPAGTIYGTWSDDSQSSVDYLSFDLSVAGIKAMTAKQQFTNGDNLFRRTGHVSLVDGGVSSVKLASSGSWGGNSFSQRGAAKFDADFGAALFQNSGTHEGSEFTWVNRSFFSMDGLKVAEAASGNFAAGGSLAVAAADVPEFLTSSDTIPTADGWVGGGCADFDEEIELDVGSAAHQACEQNHDNQGANCWGAEFEQGEGSNEL